MERLQLEMRKEKVFNTLLFSACFVDQVTTRRFEGPIASATLHVHVTVQIALYSARKIRIPRTQEEATSSSCDAAGEAFDACET